MMRRLFAITNFSFILCLAGLVCYVLYSSTTFKVRVVENKTNSRSSATNIVQKTINTNTQRAEQESSKPFPVEQSSSSKTAAMRRKTIATTERTTKHFSEISSQKASTFNFPPLLNMIKKMTQKLIKKLGPSLKNFKVSIKNYSTAALGGFDRPIVKEPLAFETAKQKENVDLFIAILSAPQRLDRRAVLRNTWISSIPNYSVAFRFFTDGKELSNRTKKMLSKEQKRFGDVEMLPTKGGYWFSHRFLHALFWAHRHYNFSYFLRLDDDYFICLHHLYHELQHRKKEKFLYWGWLWCQEEIVRIDEAFVLLGADLAHEIIRRNESLYCHPFGDQMIEMWFSRFQKEGITVKYFPDNSRLLQFGLGSYQLSQRMCQDLLGIHKTYPDQMRLYWNRTKDVWYSSPRLFKEVTINDYTKYCRFPRGYDWKAISEYYRHEPKPCWKPGVDWPGVRSHNIHLGDESSRKAQLKNLQNN